MAFVPSHFSVIFQMPSLPSFAANWTRAERQSIAQRLCFYGIHLDFSIASGVLKRGEAPVVDRATFRELHRTTPDMQQFTKTGFCLRVATERDADFEINASRRTSAGKSPRSFSSHVIPHAQPSRIAQTRSQRSDTRGCHREQIRPKPGLYRRALA